MIKIPQRTLLRIRSALVLASAEDPGEVEELIENGGSHLTIKRVICCACGAYYPPGDGPHPEKPRTCRILRARAALEILDSLLEIEK